MSENKIILSDEEDLGCGWCKEIIEVVGKKNVYYHCRENDKKAVTPAEPVCPDFDPIQEVSVGELWGKVKEKIPDDIDKVKLELEDGKLIAVF